MIGVQFQLNGADLGAEDQSAPYAIGWDSTQFADGVHSLVAVARDAAGNQTTSSVISVTVDNADRTAPTVSIAAPENDATVSGTLTVFANAADDIGVIGVQFKLNGANLGAEDLAAARIQQAVRLAELRVVPLMVAGRSLVPEAGVAGADVGFQI